MAKRERPAEKDAPAGVTPADAAAVLSAIDDFDRKMESSRKVLEDLAAQLGALARMSFNTGAGAEAVVPRLVEMHNSLSNIHSSLEDSFEGIRTRYTELKDRCTAMTGGCSKELSRGRAVLQDLGRRMERGSRKPSELLRLLKEENALFTSALERYNAVLTTVSTMRQIDSRVGEVFNDFSETIGRIDCLSRTMGEFISTEETRAFEEELEGLRKTRDDKVRRYIH
jgi:predicted  nucleic acid-binding Zn-ribbon protein